MPLNGAMANGRANDIALWRQAGSPTRNASRTAKKEEECPETSRSHPLRSALHLPARSRQTSGRAVCAARQRQKQDVLFEEWKRITRGGEKHDRGAKDMNLLEFVKLR